ncbi:hypothetical protein ACKI16_46370, partial [Streptomyces scabiei]|uniref:hypothetical protein n=1 Tax=Streptomyces scabiei TaxID=1930 RepID=UPI0038F78AA8
MADESLETQRRLALIETRLEGMENRIAALEERLRIPTFSPSKREALERLSQPTPPPRVRVVPESPRVPGPAVEPQETAKTR